MSRKDAKNNYSNVPIKFDAEDDLRKIISYYWEEKRIKVSKGDVVSGLLSKEKKRLKIS